MKKINLLIKKQKNIVKNIGKKNRQNAIAKKSINNHFEQTFFLLNE